MKKQYVIKIIICAILSIVLILGNLINSYASETTESGDHGGSGIYRGNIYSSNNMNQQVISAWNSLTADERADLVPSLYPMIMNKLGVVSGNPVLDYEIVSSYWTDELNIYKGAYSSYQDFYSDVSRSTALLYGNGERFYDYFYEFLYDHIQLVDNELVTDSQTNNMLVSLTNEYVSEHTPVYEEITIPSVTRLDASMNWNNYGQYKSVVDFCSGLDEGYVSMAYWYVNNTTKIGNVQILYVPKSVSYGLIGTANGGICDIEYAINWVVSTNPKTQDSRIKIYTINQNGIVTDTTSNPQPASIAWRNITNKTSFGLYGDDTNLMTTNSKNQKDYVFPNIASFRAYSGGQNPYEFQSYWGSVPSTTISSNDMTSYYNSNYTSSVDSHNNTTTNIYYPDSYTPYDNTYDDERHTLDFSGVGALLASIGNFIGSIINGIAQGIANLINSISSIFQNLSGLINGNISGFLGAVFGFLPSEFVTVLLAGISLSVLFMILSFIRR